MIYVTLVPYAAIAFTILYFDLKLARNMASSLGRATTTSQITNG
jgi:hypothetical protein